MGPRGLGEGAQQQQVLERRCWVQHQETEETLLCLPSRHSFNYELCRNRNFGFYFYNFSSLVIDLSQQIKILFFSFWQGTWDSGTVYSTFHFTINHKNV